MEKELRNKLKEMWKKNNKEKWFVRHIERHIQNNEFGKKGNEITKDR